MREEIPYGLLELLLLRTLARAKQMHGFEIVEEIRSLSENILQVEEGSFYPALQRLLLNGWGRTRENHRARYYRLTPTGRKHLEREFARYKRVSAAVQEVLEPA